MFHIANIQNKRILKSDLIQSAQAFFTTRDSFLLTKDEKQPQIVSENRAIVCEYLNIPPENLITPVQTHSSNIAIAQKGQSYPNTDGLILTDSKLAIFLNFADCTPLIFYDEKQNIGAVSHAGWRGTEQKIGVLTIEKLVKDFNSQLENIKILIGPAICKTCYNVQEDVFQKLKNTVKNFENLYEIKNNQIFVDLKNINKQQFLETGIPSQNIDVCTYCTCCNNDLFFSYRNENKTTKRHNALLKLC